MKRLILICSLFTCVTTNIFTAAAEADYYNDDLLLNCCLICGEEAQETLTNLCPKASDHSLCCTSCAPKLLEKGKCSSCYQPFSIKTLNKKTLPPLEVENLKKRITQERIDAAEGRIAIMQNSLEEYKRGQRTASNRETIAYLTTGIEAAQNQKNQWKFIITIYNYAQAWNNMLANLENDAILNQVGEILTDNQDLEKQGYIHLIGIESGRLSKLSEQVLESLKHSDGSDQDILPDLLKISSMPMELE